MRVLLVEDDPKMALLLERGLDEEGFLADIAADGKEGLWAAQENEYDAIVLDVMLPDCTGFELCRQLRAAHLGTAILMLTARGSVTDRIKGLDAGADDYLLKPFAFDELLARLRALLRRGHLVPTDVFTVGGLRLSPSERRVWRGDHEVALTGQEFSLLLALATRPGRVLTRAQLVHLAWDVAVVHHSNAVDVCMRGLRARIDRPFGSDTVQTVRGVGYRLRSEKT